MPKHGFRVVSNAETGHITVETEIRWAEDELRKTLKGDRDITALLHYIGVLHQLRVVADNGCLGDFLATTLYDFVHSDDYTQIVAGANVATA